MGRKPGPVSRNAVPPAQHPFLSIMSSISLKLFDQEPAPGSRDELHSSLSFSGKGQPQPRVRSGLIPQWPNLRRTDADQDASGTGVREEHPPKQSSP